MAAGLGFKDFVTGEVLTAADVDGYLMQGVWVFASATARDAAVTSPQEGNFAYLKDTNVTTYYTGSAWANLDTTGMTNPMTTTGDTIYSSSGSTPARLGIGTAGQVLQVNSGATAPEWATPAGGGGMTLLSTTSLSGSSVTISSINQSYTNLFVVIYQVATAANDAGIRIAPNGTNNISSNLTNTQAVTIDAYGDTYLRMYANLYPPSSSTSANSAYALTINSYSSSTQRKSFTGYGAYHTTAYGYITPFFSVGGINTTTAISSLEISLTTSTFSSGTVLVYGVK
jgi:hypothetical protein